MKKSKLIKRVTALALCGVMFMGGTASATTVLQTKYVTSASGDLLSTTKLFRSDNLFSAETIVAKNSNGANAYPSSLYMQAYLYCADTKAYSTSTCRNNTSAGQTINPKVSRQYVDFVIRAVSGTITTNSRKLVVNY